MNRTSLASAGILLGAVFLFGCEAREAPVETVAVRDSAGITIVENSTPLIPDQIELVGPPFVVVPADFGEPEHYLFAPRSAVALPGGGFVIGNAGSQQLFYFDEDGEFLRAVGGQGDGPGELRVIFGLSRCAGGLLAVEEVRRISFFTDDGAFRSTTRISGHLAESRASLVGVSSDCTSGLMSSPSPPRPAARNEGLELYGPLYWASFETGQSDTVVIVNIAEANAIDFRGGLMWLYVPYGARGVFAADGESVVFGSSRTPEVRRVDREGVTQSIIRWAGDPAPLSDEDWEFFEESQAELLRKYPEERPYLPDLDLYVRVDQKPAYTRIIVDGAGRIWIQAYEQYRLGGPTSSPNWWVFDASGRWLARVRMPEGLTILAISDRAIIGAVVDQLDVERIEVHHVPDLGPG